MKKNKEKKVKKSNKEGFISGIKAEMKKVKWPSFKEMLKYTIATIALVVVVALLFELLNVIISLVKGVI
jgi:preprotein translocase subunit SecE